MISHEHRFIFIHIPKTGGTTIEHILRSKGVVLQGQRNFKSVYYKHATAADISSMLGSEFDQYDSFSIVRNPFDWAVSNYFFNRGLARPWVIGTKYSLRGSVPDWAADMSFRQWLAWWIEELSPSQRIFLKDHDGEQIVSDIFPFENFKSTARTICSRVGIPASRQDIPHLKASKRNGPDGDLFDDASSALIREYFAEDLAIWEKATSDLNMQNEQRPDKPAAARTR